MRTTSRILLVDDHPLVRDMLAECLAREPSFTVVGRASSADQAVALAKKHRPNIIVMDIDMPGMTCFDAAREITAELPEVRLLFLSAFTLDHYIEQALSVGALGYVSKSEPTDTLIAAIHAVAARRAYFSDEIQARIVCGTGSAKLTTEGRSRASNLSPREMEILRLIAQGMTKKEIAATMGISVKTVESHSTSLMSKLDIHDRVGLARYAIREGFAKP